ncbi:hypothetical protein [Hydrocoleum sp. CS-953]|nr:hypothetical protein [Hydrocoleum sp. CS-953]
MKKESLKWEEGKDEGRKIVNFIAQVAARTLYKKQALIISILGFVANIY